MSVPGLPALLEENRALAAAFTAWHERFPNLPAFHSPLNPNWRYRSGDETQDDLAALEDWVTRLIAYLQMLQRYYMDVLERPDKLQRFLLMDLVYRAGVFAQSHTLRGENCLAVLATHIELLSIEQENAWNGEFRQFLAKAIDEAKRNISGAADEMGIDRATLSDHLARRPKNIHTDTKNKMRNFILKYCPDAKQQIQQLFIRSF